MRPSTHLLTTALSLLTAHTTALALPSTTTTTTTTTSTDANILLTLLSPAKAAAALSRANVTLPTSSLPSPPTGLTLKYVAIGLGTQNYTCVAAGSSTSSSSNTTTSTTTTTATATPTTATLTPVSAGALATLHDASRLLATPKTPLDYALPNLACIADGLDFALNLPVLGHHYFTSSLVPTFDLSPVGLFFSGAKSGDVVAPAGSCGGRNGMGAVDWLMLGDKGGSTGVSLVYRVETAGGKSAGCGGAAEGDVVVSDYAAEYWFYG